MWYWVKEKILDFIDRHLVLDFPDPLECFYCNQGNCKECEIYLDNDFEN